MTGTDLDSDSTRRGFVFAFAASIQKIQDGRKRRFVSRSRRRKRLSLLEIESGRSWSQGKNDEFGSDASNAVFPEFVFELVLLSSSHHICPRHRLNGVISRLKK